MIRGKCGILGALIFQLGRFEILAFTMSICYNCQEPVACSDLDDEVSPQAIALFNTSPLKESS